MELNMETEILKIFNENHVEIGVTTRAEVHKLGHWHETFHCWLVSQEDDNDYIYFQLRSEHKKDYPNLLDITAAGHILANETVVDGIRELKEEIGIEVNINELIYLGMIKYSQEKKNFIDKELAHVFLYKFNQLMDELILQKEEVAGVVKVKISDFRKLNTGELNEIKVEGYKIDNNGNKNPINETVGKNYFVPHANEYYKSILSMINKHLE
jgi:isopentenyldiphosphate isomerase